VANAIVEPSASREHFRRDLQRHLPGPVRPPDEPAKVPPSLKPRKSGNGSTLAKGQLSARQPK
jgi:hypothetical protein